MVGKRSAARFAGACALVASTAAVVWAAAGDLDTTFDGDGVVQRAMTSSLASIAQDCAVQSDGKVVAIGTDGPAGTTVVGWRIGRWNTDGSLDTSFGSSGVASLFGSGTSSDVARGVAIDASGRIVVAGDSVVAVTVKGKTTYERRVTVVRLTSGGALDTTFGTGGSVSFAISGASSPTGWAVALAPDGKIVVGGDAVLPGRRGGADQREVFVARLTSAGALDASFGTSGVAVRDITSGDDNLRHGAVAVQSDGRVVVASRHSVIAGTSSYEAGEIVRFTSAGAYDTTFGVVSSPNAPYDTFYGLAVDGSDRIVVAGRRGSSSSVNVGDMLAVRLTSGGAFDSSFGTGGIAAVDTAGDEFLTRVAVAADGRLVFAGEVRPNAPTTNERQPVVARLTSSGAADTTFGTGGAARLSVGDTSFAVSIAPDGRIVLGSGGNVGGTRVWLLARYLSN
jgi:uncharacterized delta-60 repeat protein